MAGWGDGGPAEEGGGEAVSSDMIPLGNGDYMQLNPEFFKQLLHHPVAVAELKHRAEAICETANNMAITKGAEYIVTVQNRSDTTRARARVRPGGDDPVKAMVDDAAHSTLLKAMEQYPSDPVPTVEPVEVDGGEPDPAEAPPVVP